MKDNMQTAVESLNRMLDTTKHYDAISKQKFRDDLRAALALVNDSNLKVEGFFNLMVEIWPFVKENVDLYSRDFI